MFYNVLRVSLGFSNGSFGDLLDLCPHHESFGPFRSLFFPVQELAGRIPGVANLECFFFILGLTLRYLLGDCFFKSIFSRVLEGKSKYSYRFPLFFDDIFLYRCCLGYC